MDKMEKTLWQYELHHENEKPRFSHDMSHIVVYILNYFLVFQNCNSAN